MPERFIEFAKIAVNPLSFKKEVTQDGQQASNFVVFHETDFMNVFY
jgi:hypothetical protein